MISGFINMDVTKTEVSWLPLNRLAAGTIVFKYSGCDYGLIDKQTQYGVTTSRDGKVFFALDKKYVTWYPISNSYPETDPSYMWDI